MRLLTTNGIIPPETQGNTAGLAVMYRGLDEGAVLAKIYLNYNPQ
jgi:hypothetical protein